MENEVSIKKKEEEKQDEHKKQKHWMHLLPLAMKTKLSLNFNLSYIEQQEFMNSILSWFNTSMEETLKFVPLEAVPAFEALAHEFKVSDVDEDLKKQLETVLSALSGELSHSFGIDRIFTGITDFIEENGKEFLPEEVP